MPAKRIEIRTSVGRLLVDEWPEEVEFSQEFLDGADPAYVKVDGDRVHITADNGAATYVLTEKSPVRMAWCAGRLYGRIDL